jgi:hypothetical protein
VRAWGRQERRANSSYNRNSDNPEIYRHDLPFQNIVLHDAPSANRLSTMDHDATS